MKKISVLMLSCVLGISYLHAQTNTFPSTGAAGIGTTTPNASSILEMVSTSKGMLIPRMTKTQRDNIAITPPTGLLIYQTNNTPGFYYYTGTAWTAVTPKSKGWSLTGNAGTVPGTNFIGTADAQPLMLKVNNIKAGYIDFDIAKANTGFGYQTLYNTTGTYNTANGFEALYANTTGGGNSANGYQALFSNNVGNSNTANGSLALFANTTGGDNTAIGASALYANTSGYNNTAIGEAALFTNIAGYNGVAIGLLSQRFVYNLGTGWDNTNTSLGFQSLRGSVNAAANTGAANTAIGRDALLSNSSGSFNTATGLQALTANTTGNYNTANGQAALFSNTSGYNNTAIGLGSLFFNTTGFYNTASGWAALNNNIAGAYNTATGYQSLYSNNGDFAGELPLGSYNTSSGSSALYSNSTGSYNTANGYSALYSNTTGYSNTANGPNALSSNTTGYSNTALGSGANVLTGNLNNAAALGSLAIVDVSNKVRVGNTTVTSIGGQVGWSTFSDGRYKKNIKEDIRGLAFINSLKPITYTVDINGLNTYFDKNSKHDSAYEKMKKDMQPSADEASKIVYNGFVAQDVEAAAKKLNYNFSGVDKPKTNDGLYGLRYGDFVVPLVKAVQELSKMNDSLKETATNQQSSIVNLQKENKDLQKQFNDLKTLVLSIQQCSPCNASGATAQTYNTTITDGAALEQNVPNPFNHSTSIGYTLRQKFTTAQIMITDKAGKTLKLVDVSGSGKGHLNVDASILASGAYNYSLLVDGKLIGTKQMILAK